MVTSIFSFVAQSRPSLGYPLGFSYFCPYLGCLFLTCCSAVLQGLLSLLFQVRATVPASCVILVTFPITLAITNKKQSG